MTFEDGLETTVGCNSLRIVWREIWTTLTRQSEPNLSDINLYLIWCLYLKNSESLWTKIIGFQIKYFEVSDI